MEIAPQIHRIPCVFMGERVAYVHLLIGEEFSLLLDTCCAHNPEQEILPYMERIGFDRERLSYILISHSDLDHQGGNEPMKAAAPNAKLLCHSLDRPWIESTAAILQGRYLQFDEPHGLETPAEAVAEMRALTLSCPLDGTLEGGERFRLGPDWWVRVVNTPGHTYGHIALYCERSRTLLAGEAALWHAILDRDDRPVLPPTYCYVDSYLQTIDRLLEMPIEAFSAAHWPVYRETADIQAFLRESREYCWFVEEQLLLFGREMGRFRLQDALRELAPKVRRWDESGDGLLTFPFCGNLARLTQRGLLKEGKNAAGWVEWSLP
ncbi:MAG: MBL fold metallo-hydrolase [Chloroflexi bacterium]|nr:MBL fold metallo-hydrolase [Chloroflexota bacterium]